MPSAEPHDGEGLGNYKGVMLCNRPGLEQAGKEQSAPPFIPVTIHDPTGVPPPYMKGVTAIERVKHAKKRASSLDREKALKRAGGDVAALEAELQRKKLGLKEKHIQWLRSLEEKGKAAEEERKKAEMDKGEKAVKLKALSNQYRTDVRGMIAQAKEERPKPKRSIPKWVKERWDKRIFEEALNLTRGSADNAPSAPSAQPDAENEIEPVDDLLDFASGLNFDEFIEDLEFREALAVLRDRAKRLEREEKLFQMNVAGLLEHGVEQGQEGVHAAEEGDHDEVESQFSFRNAAHLTAEDRRLLKVLAKKEKYRARMPAGLAEKYWGEIDAGSEADTASDVSRLVDEVLPKLKQIHSKQSAAKVVEGAVSGST